MSTNHAAWVDGPSSQVRVGVHSLRDPGPGEVIVRNHAVAVNPFDCLQHLTGNFVENWPCIFGYDLAGEVVSVGAGVAHLVPGQRVVAQALKQSLENTAFQEYSIVHEELTCPIPESMTYESACVIPLALSTAAAGLYQDGYLALPLPSSIQSKRQGRAILVWGGSSSVGSAVIQLASASGIDVITTASPRNFDYCSKLGAKLVFDHNSPTVAEDIIEVLRTETEVVGAFCAVSLPSNIINCVGRIIAAIGGGFIATTKPPPEDLPDSVSARMVFAADYAGREGKKYFKDFLPAALQAGTYQAAPAPRVVGRGLSSVQTGVELLSRGVSAAKVVISL
ncbi:chaperonin 10-like protein [Xylariales sp. PMI_506]|nr:chaperonin 10-like protein [Xylariales sp. PMI_506]